MARRRGRRNAEHWADPLPPRREPGTTPEARRPEIIHRSRPDVGGEAWRAMLNTLEGSIRRLPDSAVNDLARSYQAALRVPGATPSTVSAMPWRGRWPNTPAYGPAPASMGDARDIIMGNVLPVFMHHASRQNQPLDVLNDMIAGGMKNLQTWGSRSGLTAGQWVARGGFDAARSAGHSMGGEPISFSNLSMPLGEGGEEIPIEEVIAGSFIDPGTVSDDSMTVSSLARHFGGDRDTALAALQSLKGFEGFSPDERAQDPVAYSNPWVQRVTQHWQEGGVEGVRHYGRLYNITLDQFQRMSPFFDDEGNVIKDVPASGRLTGEQRRDFLQSVRRSFNKDIVHAGRLDDAHMSNVDSALYTDPRGQRYSWSADPKAMHDPVSFYEGTRELRTLGDPESYNEAQTSYWRLGTGVMHGYKPRLGSDAYTAEFKSGSIAMSRGALFDRGRMVHPGSVKLAPVRQISGGSGLEERSERYNRLQAAAQSGVPDPEQAAAEQALGANVDEYIERRMQQEISARLAGVTDPEGVGRSKLTPFRSISGGSGGGGPNWEENAPLREPDHDPSHRPTDAPRRYQQPPDLRDRVRSGASDRHQAGDDKEMYRRKANELGALYGDPGSGALKPWEDTDGESVWFSPAKFDAMSPQDWADWRELGRLRPLGAAQSDRLGAFTMKPWEDPNYRPASGERPRDLRPSGHATSAQIANVHQAVRGSPASGQDPARSAENEAVAARMDSMRHVGAGRLSGPLFEGAEAAGIGMAATVQGVRPTGGDHPIYGRPDPELNRDRYMAVDAADNFTGEIIFDENQVREMRSSVAGSLVAASGRSSPGGAAGVANIVRDVGKMINDEYDKQISTINKELEQTGDQDRFTGAKQMATRMRAFKKDLLNFALRDEVGNEGAAEVRQLQYQSMNVTPEQALRIGKYNATVAAGIENMGGERAFMREAQSRGVLLDAGTGGPGIGAGAGFPMGPGGPGRGLGGGRMGMWAGGLGSALYGAYITKRFWSMFAQPIFQAGEEFDKDQYAMSGAIAGASGVEGLQGTPAGAFQARGLAQHSLGAGTHQLMGSGSEMLNRFIGRMDPGQAAMAQSVGLAMAGAATAHTVGTTLGAVGAAVPGAGVLATAGSALTPIGLAVGAGLITYGAYRWMDYEHDLWRDDLLSEGYQYDEAASARRTLGSGSRGLRPRTPLAEGQVSGPGGAWTRTGRIDAGATQRASARDIDRARQSLADRAGVEMPETAGAFYSFRGLSGEYAMEGTEAHDIATRMLLRGKARGLTGDQISNEGGQYAEALGYTPGTMAAARAADVFTGMGGVERYTASQQAQMVSGNAGLFRQLISRDQMGNRDLYQFAEQFATPFEGQRAYGASRQFMSWGASGKDALSMGATMAVGGTELEQGARMGALARAAPYLPAPTSVAGLRGHGDYGTARQVGPMADLAAIVNQMPYQEAQNFGARMAGDIGAWSYDAYAGGWAGGMMQDRSGNPIIETDWAGFMGMGIAQAGAGDFTAASRAFGGIDPSASLQDQTAAFFSGQGINVSEGLMGALMEGGMRGASRFQAERMFGFQMAGIGRQGRDLEYRKDYLWGAGGGGAWDAPTAGSLWGLEDTQRGLQHTATLAGFASTERRMTTTNLFAQQGEALQSERMGVGTAYQRWQTGFERGGQILGREWQREDWQYSDQMRSLQFSWQMEDLDEGIRLSSGRDRRQLIKQRDRAATTHNLEDQQVDQQRDRQEQSWAREDERFEKQVEYQERIIELDQRQFDLGVEQRTTLYDMDREDFSRRVEEYNEMHSVQERILEVQRKFQAEELERQREALGLQAAAAAAQYEYNQLADVGNKIMGDIAGEFRNIAQYRNAVTVANAIGGLAKTLGGVNLARLEAVLRIMQRVET